MKVRLKIKEYNYLVSNLLKNNQKLLLKLKFENIDTNSIDIYLDEDVADEIRELASDELVLHFDEKYVPTEEGRILELFIGKFYTG
ncbi:hypothetical protein [Marinilabilia salmonicolor]|uniref:Uncharacterized protein n=1 Tax=Marinilabilia salmonicolor TaxID=989 RepID=A0A368UTC6_9BACT|nr:hypothetical protein [Marinilabilia salmonicolor]RCW31953.1 hypothetical protein DFO77_11620 [Marinilabilia salmonicolor]